MIKRIFLQKKYSYISNNKKNKYTLINFWPKFKKRTKIIMNSSKANRINITKIVNKIAKCLPN